jgi:hypothetical protein
MVAADPGDGLTMGSCVLHPYVDLSVTHDSNPARVSTDPESDQFADSYAGMRLGYSAFMLDIDGQGFVGARNYRDLSEDDFSVWGEMLGLRYGQRDNLLIELSQSFRLVEDYDRFLAEGTAGGVSPDSILDASARDRREVDEAGLSVGSKLTDKLDLNTGYRFAQVNYLTSGLYDTESHIGEVETSYRATDKTDAFLLALYGMQSTTASTDYGDQMAFRAGLKSRGTDRITYKVGAGVKQFTSPDGAGDRTFFHYDASAVWKATDKILGQLGVRNGAVVSAVYADNSTEYWSAWAGPLYQATPSLALTANVTYREDDYFKRVQVNDSMMDRADKGVAGRLRADYLTVHKFMRLYGEAMYEKVDSTVVSSYDDMRLTLGMSVQY